MLEDGGRDLGSDGAEESVLDGLGLVGAGAHPHQHPPAGLSKDLPGAHGAGVGGHLVDAGEEALVGVPGALGEGDLMGAGGEGVGGLVEADVAVDAQAQRLHDPW